MKALRERERKREREREKEREKERGVGVRVFVGEERTLIMGLEMNGQSFETTQTTLLFL